MATPTWSPPRARKDDIEGRLLEEKRAAHDEYARLVGEQTDHFSRHSHLGNPSLDLMNKVDRAERRKRRADRKVAERLKASREDSR